MKKVGDWVTLEHFPFADDYVQIIHVDDGKYIVRIPKYFEGMDVDVWVRRELIDNPPNKHVYEKE